MSDKKRNIDSININDLNDSNDSNDLKKSKNLDNKNLSIFCRKHNYIHNIDI